MNMVVRLVLIVAAAAAFPAMVFSWWQGPGGGYAAAAAVLVSVFLGVRVMLCGMGAPLSRMSGAVKAFRAADYRLESPLVKEGWPETVGLISALNRLMLELGAFRSFHINQIVEERAKAQALIETISDAVLLVDDRGRLIHSNKLALSILRVAAETQDIILPDSVGEAAFRPVLKDILASRDNFVKAEVSVPCGGVEQESPVNHDSMAMSNRSRALLTANIAPINRDFRIMSNQFLLAAFKRPGRVIVIRDVTMEKEIESARETFFHMITHDMRAPLASIQGYAQLMEKCVPRSDRTDKYLSAIVNSSKRLNGMIEDILNTIKLERGGMELVLESVDAAALCSRVYEVHEPQAARKSVAFSVILPEVEMRIKCDARLLERVISNLVGNSLKFTPQGGQVTLSCRQEGADAVFSVADNGPGIPEGKQAEIFEKFSQLEEHRYMGFGLGLAMCKMAVNLHGGRIWVDSQEGRGSTFSFSVPAGGGDV